MSKYVVCALYKFVTLENFEEMRAPLLNKMEESGVKGTLLLALEGVNGTISGTRQGINAVLHWLNDDPRINPISFKESYDEEQPFYRTKVKLKKKSLPWVFLVLILLERLVLM